MKYGLSDSQLSEIVEILSAYPEVEEALIFGSRAIDTFKEASDVDIAIKGKRVTASLAAKIKYHFEEETYLPFFFDIVAYPTISNEELKKQIDTKGISIYKVGWRECKLGEVIEIIGGGTPKTSVSEYWNGDIPWLSVVDFNNGNKYVSTAEKSITKLGLQKSSTKVLNAKDVIISARGTVGVVAVLTKPMAFNQSCYGIRNIKTVSDQDFLYYLLKDSVNNLKQYSYGGVFDTITRETFDSIDISLPPLPEQKAIASVLSSLDDKIDLLHRQNKTLEAMAETLFRQWFGEKENDDTINQIVVVQNGYAFKSKDFKESGTNGVIKIKNISGGMVDIQKTDFVDNSVALNVHKRFGIVSGDILIAMTGAEIGKLGIVPETEKKLWLNQRVGLIKEKFKGSKYIAYLQLKSDFGQDYIENTATGSAQPNISGDGIEKCSFPKLKENEIKNCSEQIGELFEKVIFNMGEIRTLEKLRDTLLPKLMSGEVRVEI
ncbi:MAG: restriction endonuclease subunit S [bacterium]